MYYYCTAPLHTRWALSCREQLSYPTSINAARLMSHIGSRTSMPAFSFLHKLNLSRSAATFYTSPLLFYLTCVAITSTALSSAQGDLHVPVRTHNVKSTFRLPQHITFFCHECHRISRTCPPPPSDPAPIRHSHHEPPVLLPVLARSSLCCLTLLPSKPICRQVHIVPLAAHNLSPPVLRRRAYLRSVTPLVSNFAGPAHPAHSAHPYSAVVRSS
jgi:hypothetical protein